MEEAVGGGSSSAFHCHATLPRMLGATLRREEVGQGGEPRETRRWAATGMRALRHRPPLPRDGGVGLLLPGAGRQPRGSVPHRRPAGWLGLPPLAPPGAVGLPGGVGARGGTGAAPLAPRQPPEALPLAHPLPHSRPLRAPRRVHRGPERRQGLRALVARMAQAVAQARCRAARAPPVHRAVAARAPPAPAPRGWRLGERRAVAPGRGLAKRRGPGRRGVTERPDAPATHQRREGPRRGETAAVLLVGEAIRG
jgi:hypothetical protein